MIIKIQIQLFYQPLLASIGGLWCPVQHARQPLHKHNITVIMMVSLMMMMANIMMMTMVMIFTQSTFTCLNHLPQEHNNSESSIFIWPRRHHGQSGQV